MYRDASMGSGMVYYDPSKEIIHFGSPAKEPAPKHPRIILVDKWGREITNEQRR